MPWSTGWETLMVFGGNQASCTLESLIWGWHVVLSKNNKTCWFCIFILLLKAVNHSSMFCDVIHTFLLDLHSTGSFRMSRFQKHRGFAALPITWGFSISPDIKPQRKTVNLSFYSFPPKHFSPFRHSDLLGSAWKNSPVSWLFAMFSGSYPWIMDGNLAIHSSIVSLFTSLDSPQSPLTFWSRNFTFKF